MVNDVHIREVVADDLERCCEIEQMSYEASEAATREKIEKRIQQYPQGFIVLEYRGEVVGFINSGATYEVDMADENIKEMIGHDSAAPHIVIMSVVVHPWYRGRGFAGRLLEDFINGMRRSQKSSIFLICKSELIELYRKYGFTYLNQSASDHGGFEWHEMAIILD